METVSGAEFSVPSFTMSWRTNVPGTSAVKVGIAAAELERAAALPAGRLTKDQAKVSGLPSTSVDPAPLRVTRLRMLTV